MLTHLAALGIGLVTAIGPVAAHAAPYPAPISGYPGYGHPSYGAPTHGAPTYGAPTYGAPGYTPVPAYAPAPPLPAARRTETRSPESLRWADRNGDGSVTGAEARAFARTRFNRGDHDRNGVLRGRELNMNDDFARAASNRDGRVTRAEYEARVMSRFYSLDRNRDGTLSRQELGTDRTRRPMPAAPANTVTWSWSWSS